MAKTIKVVSGNTEGRVALWERDDEHPGGEAFVAGEDEVTVGRTALVMEKLRNGELKRAGAKADDDDE